MQLDSATVAIALAVVSLVFQSGMYVATIRRVGRDLSAINAELHALRVVATDTAVLKNQIAAQEKRSTEIDARMNLMSQRMYDLARGRGFIKEGAE